jgi:hypothetical protein
MVPGGKIDVFPEGLAAPDLVEHYVRHALPCRRLPVRLPIRNWMGSSWKAHESRASSSKRR